MSEINRKLSKPINYKKFFWAPDLSVCGFGTTKDIRNTMNILKVYDHTDRYQ